MTSIMTVTVARWRRYGKDRLYVADGDMRLGWHDLVTGRTTVEVAGRADDVHAAVQAHLPRPRSPEPPAVREQMPIGTTPVEDRGEDLATRRPGHLVRQRARQEWQEAKDRSRVRAYTDRIFDAHTDERAWRVGADGEEAVGSALERMRPPWRVVHSVPVGERGSDIDHVVIGPAGVFTVNTKHHPDARIRVYPNAVYVAGRAYPYLRNARHESDRAARMLARAVGWPVSVTPVLAFVAADVSMVSGGPADVLISPGRIARRLAERPVTLTKEQIEDLFAVARWSATWTTRS